MKKNSITIEKKDRSGIAMIASLNLSEKELFGLECYLAGTRAAGRSTENQTGSRQQATQGEAV